MSVKVNGEKGSCHATEAGREQVVHRYGGSMVVCRAEVAVVG